METTNSIRVTVDKSHIVTIGEKLYAESTELIRELVNNAYDADATEVKITLARDRITIEDNGTGMDLDGLRQYFNIGSMEKRHRPKSPRLGRDRIGQFGIGKFASLAACGSFAVSTQSGNFAASVTFDKDAWEKAGGSWDLPLTVAEPNRAQGDGTTVTLTRLTKVFDPEAVERRIIESVPLAAPDFSVILNDRPVKPRELSGERLPFLEGTPFGPIHGEIVLIPLSKVDVKEPLGIACKVKQVTVRREFFGMENWGKEIARVHGEVHADFLPITSDRSGFVVDSEEYRAFAEGMVRVMAQVKEHLKRLSGERESQGARRALRDALHRIQNSLNRNPEFAPEGFIPLASDSGGLGGAGKVQEPGARREATVVDGEEPIAPAKKKRVKKPKAVPLTPNAVIQRLKLGHTGITCCLDHFGGEGAECFTEGGVIYINQDHPLYRREIKKRETHTMHLARLLTQEISLMRTPKDPRDAFGNQSRLLRDAFQD